MSYKKYIVTFVVVVALEDKRICKLKKHSDYSIKSAYGLCINEIVDNSSLHTKM